MVAWMDTCPREERKTVLATAVNGKTLGDAAGEWRVHKKPVAAVGRSGPSHPVASRAAPHTKAEAQQIHVSHVVIKNFCYNRNVTIAIVQLKV
jgi:hypothetical protein